MHCQGCCEAQRPSIDRKDRVWWLRSNTLTKLLAVVFVMGACIGAAAVINHLADVARRDTGRRTLEASATDVMRTTNRSVELAERGFEMFEEVNRASPMRTAGQFARISRALVDASPFVVGTLLITELPGNERDSLEAAWEEEYPELPKHSIHNGTEQVSEEQDEYLVARFLHPTHSNAFTIDWNAEGAPSEHNRTYREALRRTLPGQEDEGGIVVSEPFRVVPRPTSPLGYMIAAGVNPPFQDCNCPAGTTGGGPDPYPAVATIAFLTQSFLTRLFGTDGEGVPKLIVWVTDVTTAGRERQLFAPGVPVPDRSAMSIYLGDYNPTIQGYVQFFDRTWSVRIEPGEELLGTLFGTTSTFWIGGVILAVVLGSLTLCLIYLRELSQEKAVVETAREATIQTHQELVSFLCHEIRNPLHVVQALVGEKRGEGLDREAQGIIRTSIRQIQYLVDDVLSARRLTESTMEVFPENTDVLVVLRNAVHKHRKAVQPGVELRFEVQPNMPRFAMVDPVRLKQVMEFAITNAVHLTSRGFISIRVAIVATSEGAWEDDVSDCRAPMSLLGECITPDSGAKADETVYDIRVKPEDTGDGVIGATAVTLEEGEKEGEERQGDEESDRSSPAPSPPPTSSSVGQMSSVFTSPARHYDSRTTHSRKVAQGESFGPPQDVGSVSPSSSAQSHASPERRARDLIGTLVVEIRNTGPPVGLPAEELFAPSTEALQSRGHSVGPLVEKLRRSFRKPPTSIRNSIDRGVFRRSAENGGFMVARDTPFRTQPSASQLSPSRTYHTDAQSGMTQRTTAASASSRLPLLAGLRPQYGNNGLGLPIGSSIVRLMRGYIGLEDTSDDVPSECSSRGVGVTRFWIAIPVPLESGHEAAAGGDERFVGTETSSSRTGSGTASREQYSSQPSSDPSSYTTRKRMGQFSQLPLDTRSLSTQIVASSATYSEAASAGEPGAHLTPTLAAHESNLTPRRETEAAFAGYGMQVSGRLTERSRRPSAARGQGDAQPVELEPAAHGDHEEREEQWNESLRRPSPVVTFRVGTQASRAQHATDARGSMTSPAGGRRPADAGDNAWEAAGGQTQPSAGPSRTERWQETHSGERVGDATEDVAETGDDTAAEREGSPTGVAEEGKRRRRRRRRHRVAKEENRGTVVVVDDDRANLMVTSRMLQRVGFQCVQLEDGIYLKKTLAEMRQAGDNPVAVLLDIVMVHSRGTDICRGLREQGESAPIAAMTGNIGDWDIREYRRAGFNSVIGKPFSAANVTSFIDAVHGLDRSNQAATSPSGVPWVTGNVRE